MVQFTVFVTPNHGLLLSGELSYKMIYLKTNSYSCAFGLRYFVVDGNQFRFGSFKLIPSKYGANLKVNTVTRIIEC